MFGIGMGELLVILVVALLFVGPERLPGAAKAIGKGLRELRKTADNIKETVESDEDLKEALDEFRSVGRELSSVADHLPSVGGTRERPARGDVAQLQGSRYVVSKLPAPEPAPEPPSPRAEIAASSEGAPASAATEPTRKDHPTG